MSAMLFSNPSSIVTAARVVVVANVIDAMSDGGGCHSKVGARGIFRAACDIAGITKY